MKLGKKYAYFIPVGEINYFFPQHVIWPYLAPPPGGGSILLYNINKPIVNIWAELKCHDCRVVTLSPAVSKGQRVGFAVRGRSRVNRT